MLEVKIVLDRVMTEEIEDVLMNVFRAYTMQVGCEMKEKTTAGVSWMNW